MGTGEYDAIVVGLGGMGSAAAYHLARRGARVLGLEQFGPAHDRGSSHGGTRVIRQAYWEGPDYVPLVLKAYDLWRALEGESGTSLLTITGALHIGPPDVPSVAGAALSARTHGIPVETLTPDEVRERYPVVRLRSGHVALYESQAGLLNPERCVTAHLDAARRRGADLRFHEAVEEWSAASGEVRVRTSGDTYGAGRLVLAAGPWTDRVVPDLALPLEVERVALCWFEPRAHIEEFMRVPICLWEDDGVSAGGFPYIEGQGIKSAFHHAHGERTTPQTIRREVSEAEVAQIRAHLATLMPDAPGTLRAVATCMYTNTPDQHFIIDRHPAHPNVVLACGFSGHGFKFACVVGDVLADLAMSGATPQATRMFALGRFGSRTAPSPGTPAGGEG
ncbi:MAG TPA: N-methyl-L-tryptophan oxidase [bacterium]|nr:N-methyl-L-tryptophan oxidase [bacterium]